MQQSRVFIYFSGHGTSTDKGGKCDQGIVAQDMKVLYRDEFQTYIDKITKNASKTLVFLDTCFSGGVVEQARALNLDKDGFPQAKFLEMKSNSGTCKADNMRSERGFSDLVKNAQSTPNYYFLGAASASQVAIDGGSNVGGWATNALLSCIEDSDQQQIRSGILTMSDVTACTQKRIDRKLKASSERNPNFPYIAMTLSVGSGVGSGSMPVGFTYNYQNNNQQPIETSELFKIIMENGDQTKKLNISALNSKVKINQDHLRLSIQSPINGYLTIFIAGSSGKIYQIFPDSVDTESYIQANKEMTLPKIAEHTYPSHGPAGKNTILAVVSSSKGRFDSLGIPVGQYRAIDNNAANAQNMALALLSPISSCGRDFGSIVNKVSECSTNYSAGMTEVWKID